MPPTQISFPPLPNLTNSQKRSYKPSNRKERYLIYFITGNPGLIAYYETYLTALYDILQREQKHGAIGDEGKNYGCINKDGGNDDGYDGVKSTEKRNVEFQVYGRSLGGFETEGGDEEHVYGRGVGSGRKFHGPYGLGEQIDFVKGDLLKVVALMRERERKTKQAQELGNKESEDEDHQILKVILVGHSVGAYIAMTILSEWQSHSAREWKETCPGDIDNNNNNKYNIASNINSDNIQEDLKTSLLNIEMLHITGTICLFPTITHIAKSKSGRFFTVSHRFITHSLFFFFFFYSSFSSFHFIKNYKTNSCRAHRIHLHNPPATLSNTILRTDNRNHRPCPLLMAAFFHTCTVHPASNIYAHRSSESNGIVSPEQEWRETSSVSCPFVFFSLVLVFHITNRNSHVDLILIISHMAKQEMQTITEDRWDARVWGSHSELPSAADVPPRAKLYFLFGENDHWVADESRDELIRRYGKKLNSKSENKNEGEDEDEDEDRGGDDNARWRSVMEIDQTGISHGFCLSMYE